MPYKPVDREPEEEGQEPNPDLARLSCPMCRKEIFYDERTVKHDEENGALR